MGILNYFRKINPPKNVYEITNLLTNDEMKTASYNYIIHMIIIKYEIYKSEDDKETQKLKAIHILINEIHLLSIIPHLCKWCDKIINISGKQKRERVITYYQYISSIFDKETPDADAIGLIIDMIIDSNGDKQKYKQHIDIHHLIRTIYYTYTMLFKYTLPFTDHNLWPSSCWSSTLGVISCTSCCAVISL
jgi:hypothetical protein